LIPTGAVAEGSVDRTFRLLGTGTF